MRIKRTFATTMREALQLVKQEQGPDAVILGNKKVPGGVELISAIDYDEQVVSEYAASAPPPSQKLQNGVVSDVAADAWVGSVISDSLDDRKEPVLGPVAGKPKNNFIETAKPPAWLERELKRSAEKLRNPPAAAAKPAPPTPSKATAKTRPVAKKVPAKKPVAKTQPKPMIDEVKVELQNLRDLMESQLSVLQWDRFSQSHPVRTVLLNLMSELGLGSDICEIVISHLDELKNDPHKVWQQALGILASCLPISRRDLLAEGGKIALVGSTGVGKTTTIAKLAARFAHIHGKRSVAMISTDNFRVGAQEQLQHFARLLEVPMLTASNGDELADRLDMLEDKKLVLIDTAGMSQRDLRLSEQFHRLQHEAPQIKPYLVLSANTQLAALNQTIQSFAKVRLAGAFVTKLDEAASLGGVITASIRHQLPLTYCGTGQRVPEDLEAAKKHRIISKAVSLMQHYGEHSDQESLALRYNHIINKKQA
ncbi:MAG: flagellar biosynthesis protein FlhF [Gammaproteobacteria bacterium]|nr:flagellar biosynthesis protein FlhF [Gammaproteobacteria bacterium]